MSKKKERLPSVKKSVSFREDVYSTAEEMADKYFGGNLSAYITYLVCADKYGVTRNQQSESDVETKEEIKEGVRNYQKSDENESYINQFLGI